MEAVAAFSLAGTILQFIDSGTKFVGLVRRLYQHKSDDDSEYVPLLKITENLDAILPELKSAENGSDREKSLGQLALDCRKTAAQLLAILRKVKTAGNSRKRDALKAAFRLVYKEDEIKSLQDQLSSFRNQLNLHLLLSLREHVSKSTEQQEEVLRKLGVLHDQTMNLGGIAASVLEYLVSKGREPRDRAEDVRWLKRDLVKKMYETWADEDPLMPLSINLSQTGRERAQSLFAASLQYNGMVDLESRINRAHKSTFRWILQDNQSQDHHLPMIRWSNFREWLESDNQIYWIAGKAGSGKSTQEIFVLPNS